LSIWNSVVRFKLRLRTINIVNLRSNLVFANTRLYAGLSHLSRFIGAFLISPIQNITNQVASRSSITNGSTTSNLRHQILITFYGESRMYKMMTLFLSSSPSFSSLRYTNHEIFVYWTEKQTRISNIGFKHSRLWYGSQGKG
jgi:hypothetical protein